MISGRLAVRGLAAGATELVGLVIVSHSKLLADGVLELARQMGGGEVAIETAGGMADGEIGTDVEAVSAAIERAASPDGVLVLMDLGSAVMSAEMAAEMVGGTRVELCEAPLVEGAVTAAALAGAGAPLDEVAAEARRALGIKASQLGVEEPAPAPPPVAAEDGQEARLPVGNRLGLHARPAARVVETAGRFDAAITLADETTGRGPADARSLTGLMTLGARQGHTVIARATGPDADAALAALRELAEGGWGDEDGGAAPPPAAAGEAAAGGVAAAGEAAGDVASPPAAGARLRGVPASSGIAIAPARHLSAAAPPAEEAPAGAPDEERTRLENAREAARRGIVAARDRIAAAAGAGEASIFDAHLALLDDAALLDPVRREIDGGRSAAAAWKAAAEDVAAAYRGLDDEYLRERAADVDDVAVRVLRHLTGAVAPAGISEPGILVVRDLTPGDAAALDRALVRGLAVARGGATSHAAILARALGIPAVVGLGDKVLQVGEGAALALDGDAGTVDVEPSEAALADAEAARTAADERRRRARERAREPARMRDGHAIEVAANIGAAAEAREAVELGAEGVGLLRTEFLFLDRDEAPSEDEQRAVYGEIAGALQGRPLIVRTLDAGADKPLRFLRQAPEDNPFLGVRGIRLSLAHPDLLRAQLKAIVAVAREHPVRVMFPMVSTLAEYRAARALLDEVRGDAEVPAGIMVEVPAVALAAERFAREVDFFSIGTNDLTQYTLAAERGNEGLAGLVAGPAPAVLRLIASVTATRRWVGVCGELAGDPAAAVLLAGLGVRELSMAPPRIPELKEALRAVSLEQAREAARRALETDDAGAAAALGRALVAA